MSDDSVAFVVENFDREDHSRLTGTFAAHVETGEGRVIGGPEDASVADALKWARSRASRVLVRLGPRSGPSGRSAETLYTAGSEPITEDGALPWPVDGMEVRPRPVGTSPDGATQTKRWPVRLVLTLRSPPSDTEKRIRAILARNAALERTEYVEQGDTITVSSEVQGAGLNDVIPVVQATQAAIGLEFAGSITGLFSDLSDF